MEVLKVSNASEDLLPLHEYTNICLDIWMTGLKGIFAK